MDVPAYIVAADIQEPKFDADRRYLAAERDYARRQMEQASGRWWSMASVPSLGIYGPDDWKKYLKSLDNYEHQLDKYEREQNDGLTPINFTVINSTDHSDSKIWIRVEVEDGEIREKKKAPERPTRIDGGATKKSKLPALTRFSRTGIKITGHRVEAVFSSLGPHDGAALVNQTIFVAATGTTRLHFELKSSMVEHLKGEVDID